MSETQAPQAQGPSAGMLLRQAREAAGLHTEALAMSLKVPVRQIEALEQDQIELLPDTVYARALAASLCRNMKVDPQLVLARMPQGRPVSRIGDREPINEPFRTPGDSAMAAWRDRLGRPPVIAALVLLLGALILLVLPLVQNSATKALAPSATPAPDSTATQPEGQGAMPGVVIESVQPPGLPASGAASPAPSPVMPAPAPTATPGAAAPAAATQPVVAEAPQAAASASAAPLMSMRARGESWVQVSDARGAVPVRRLLAAGETVTVAGVPPLSVTVGSASATEVSVRGRPFDLAPVTRDNVARFQVQ